MKSRKILKELVCVVDTISVRVLLALLGLSLAELAVRTLGFRPWEVDPANQIRQQYVEVDPEIGWHLRPQEQPRVWSGRTYHSETILPDHTRLVTGTSQNSSSPTVVVVGDSAIYGWGLGDEETFASRLSEHLPDWRIINGAVPGYGALQSYLRTRQLLQRVKPQIVIMGYADYFPERDLALLSWTVPRAEHSTTNNTVMPHADIHDDRLSVEPATPVFIELPLRRHSAIVRIVEELVAGIPAALRRRRQDKITHALFQEWARLVADTGAVPVVMLWNNAGHLNKTAGSLSQIGIRVVDCSHPLQGHPETIQPGDGHPSADVVKSWSVCVKSHLMDLLARDLPRSNDSSRSLPLL